MKHRYSLYFVFLTSTAGSTVVQKMLIVYVLSFPSQSHTDVVTSSLIFTLICVTIILLFVGIMTHDLITLCIVTGFIQKLPSFFYITHNLITLCIVTG